MNTRLFLLLFSFLSITMNMDGKVRSVKEVFEGLKAKYDINLCIPESWSVYPVVVGFQGNDYKNLLDDVFNVVVVDSTQSRAVLISDLCLTDKNYVFYRKQLCEQIMRSLGIKDEKNNQLLDTDLHEPDYLTEMSGYYLKSSVNADSLIVAKTPLNSSKFIVMHDRDNVKEAQFVERILPAYPYMFKCILYASPKRAITFTVLFNDNNRYESFYGVMDIVKWFSFNSSQRTKEDH